ncbi:hypothetical protein IAU59_004153 [Kwoniella sp. CBS 9459]
MSPRQHTARFTWGAGAQTVCVAGGFNNWSADATPLEKQADGSFAADVPLPWGEKQAFKYVVDGDWKVREDEAKEWDAAGNMNNVYTAPPVPVSTSTAGSSAPAPTSPASPASKSGPSPTVVAAPAANTSKNTSAPSPAPKEKTLSPTEDDKPSAVAAASSSSVPPADTPDTAAPVKSETTQPKTLIASSAPGAALGAPILGGPVFPASKADPSTSSPTTTTTTTTVVPPTTTSTGASAAVVPAPAPAAVPAHSSQKPLAEEPIPVQIEKVAAQANIGEAPVGPEEPGIADKASEFAAGALAAIGAVVGSAAVAVEKATGVDIAHVGPLSVDEAKARGIDINSLQKVDAETDTTSPVGAAPSASAVDALEEKVQELKLGSSSTTAAPVTENPKTATGVADVPLPKTAEPKTSLPPPGAVELVEKPVEADPEHDIPAQHETIDNHQHIPQPTITTITEKDPKKDRTANSSSLQDTAGTKPISHDPAVSAKEEKVKAETDPASVNAASNSPLNAPKVSPSAPAANIPPKPDTQAAAASGADASDVRSAAPAAAAASTPSPAAPATPAKSAATKTNGAVATPASVSSTPASTPAKSTHGREQTTDSDIRKRKSSFFTKIKHAFSPKDKEKK